MLPSITRLVPTFFLIRSLQTLTQISIYGQLRPGPITVARFPTPSTLVTALHQEKHPTRRCHELPEVSPPSLNYTHTLKLTASSSEPSAQPRTCSLASLRPPIFILVPEIAIALSGLDTPQYSSSAFESSLVLRGTPRPRRSDQRFFQARRH